MENRRKQPFVELKAFIKYDNDKGISYSTTVLFYVCNDFGRPNK